MLFLLCYLALPAGFEGYYRFPTLHEDTLVFTAEGDLWSVSSDGGQARRLTSHHGEESRAVFSPDGSQIAFSGNYEGVTEIYLISRDGGHPKRLTFDGRRAQTVGWTPDGKKVIYATDRFSTLPNRQLATVDPTTLVSEVLPLAEAADGCFEPRGKTLYFTRRPKQGSKTKRYKGGTIQHIWRFKKGDQEATPLTLNFKGTSKDPMWWKKRIYFLSDRDGIMNLYSMKNDGQDLLQHTSHKLFDASWAAMGQGRVTYKHGADLRIYDIASDLDSKVNITLVSDLEHTREKWIKKPMRFLTDVNISKDGTKLALTARGRVFVAPVKKGRFVEVTRDQGVRYRDAQFLHDNTLLAMSDKSGEMDFWKLDPHGIKPATRLTEKGPGFRHGGFPSPDGKFLAIEDKDGELWLATMETGELKQITVSPQGYHDDLSWSPDSQWLAYVEPAENGFERIFLYHSETGKTHPITSDRFYNNCPTWSPDGKWLYMVSDRNLRSATRSPWGAYAPMPVLNDRSEIYMVSLQKGLLSPFKASGELPNLDDEAEDKEKDKGENKKDKKVGPTPVTINMEGIQRRLFKVPVKPGNYDSMAANETHLYYLSRVTGSREWDLMALKIDAEDPKPKKVLAGLKSYALTNNGQKIMAHKGDNIYVFKANGMPVSKLPEKAVDLKGWTFSLDPRMEWEQMFVDSWRLMRDYFYDRDMHGLDWPAMLERYKPLLPRVTDREELADLFGEMHGELSALHVAVYGGDKRQGKDLVRQASLGALLERDPKSGGYRVTHIYEGDPDMPDEIAPLARAGVDMAVGDLILDINGVPVLSVDHPSRLLRNQTGRQVLMRIKEPSGEERQVVVEPISSRAERGLRYDSWEYQRRMMVEEAGKSDIGYVHMRAMGGRNYSEWARHYYPVANRKGLILDVRHNNGGNIDAWILNALLRKNWMWWQGRAGGPYGNMHYAFNGHMVILIDQKTSSDGETIAEGFRRLGLGKIIGKRSWGGQIWLSSQNKLVDGGIAAAPETGVYDEAGNWLIEGIGVIPDIEVDNLPHATFKGKDAQLEAAIVHLQQLIAEKPIETPQPPTYPDLSFPAKEQ